MKKTISVPQRKQNLKKAQTLSFNYFMFFSNSSKQNMEKKRGANSSNLKYNEENVYLTNDFFFLFQI